MNDMAEVHSRRGRAPVDPGFYVHWRENLLQAVSEFDPRFTPALRDQWSEALKQTTDFFTQHY